MSKSVGSQALAARGGRLEAVASRLGTSVASVSLWRSGKRNPGPEFRQAIFEDMGIPPSAWDDEIAEAPIEPLGDIAAEVAAIAAAGGAGAADAEREADRLLAIIRRCMTDIASVVDASPDRVRQLAALTAMVKQLGELTGAGLALSERAILASPNFRVIVDRCVVALEPWPEAMAAVLEAVRVQ